MKRATLLGVLSAFASWTLAGTARAAPEMQTDAPSRDDSDSDQSGAEGGAEGGATAGGDACINEDVKADLFAKRQRRDVRERLFLQTNRHELTIAGGYYVSDLFDGTYVFGGAYAYHMTEDVAVESSFAISRIASSASPELERTFVLLGTRDRRAILIDADLVWSPAHAKLRLGGAITHFDLYTAIGAGLVDSALANDIAGNVALGLKFFIGRAFAVRLDVRDHVYRQHLLAEKAWVNDITAMLGASLFLPVTE